tara:strand:+ start:6680 stop:6940 length:261 start_codon:yes stop_codon:yes gene_type:complete
MATKEIRIKQVEAIKRLIEQNDYLFRNISNISDDDYTLYIRGGYGHWIHGSPLFAAILTLNMHGHERHTNHEPLDKWKCGVYPSKK